MSLFRAKTSLNYYKRTLYIGWQVYARSGKSFLVC